MSGALERLKPGSDGWTGFYADHMVRYRFASEFVKGRRVLDAGTGHGYGAMMLSCSGAASVRAVDISAETIADAHAEYGRHGIDFAVDDCQTLAASPGPFQVVTNFENIEHVPRPADLLRAVKRVLANDGVYLTSSPDRAGTPPFVNGRPANPHHVNEWTYDEFQKLLGEHFEEVRLHVQVRSHSYNRRVRGVISLNTYLTWANPLPRLANSILKRTRGHGLYGSLVDLASPSMDDFPIVPPEMGPLVGTPWVLIAVCRHPRA